MASRVYLHIGAMKSGTSFLQHKLLANRASLAEQGVCFPGEGWRDQVRGVQDVLGARRRGAKPPATVGAWRRLLEEIEAWPGTALVSVELLASARAPQIRRIVRSLRPAEVHVVLTARDLGRTVPAMWQESVQTFHTWTWDEYVDGVANGDPDQPGPARSFWRQQDLPAIVRRWSKVVGRRNLTVVTLPPPGADRSVLWDRFCSVVEVDPAACDLPGGHSNESLGAASAEVMRRLNVALAASGLTRAEYTRYVKHPLAKSILVGHRDDEPMIGFSARWVRRRSTQQVERLARTGVRVVGDLGDLAPHKVRGVKPSTVPTEAQLDAAVTGLAGVVLRWARDTRPRPPQE